MTMIFRDFFVLAPHRQSVGRVPIQVTIPKELCDRLHVYPGDDLDFVEHEGRITIIRKQKGSSAGVLKHLKADSR
jgi:AbrB family looped-hinge helix DNA binding protein